MYKNFLKIILDYIISISLIIILCPLMLLISIAIKIDSRGTVFFRQKRCGKNKGIFEIFKFRTMLNDLEAEKKGFEPGVSKRVTKIGKFLRKSKLDEIPQLFNVLKGEMSIVGPRPEIPKYNKIYQENWGIIRSVKPGITDPASIAFINEEEILSKSSNPEKEYENVILPQKIELYEKYVKNISFRNDFIIIFKTIKKIIKN